MAYLDWEKGEGVEGSWIEISLIGKTKRKSN